MRTELLQGNNIVDQKIERARIDTYHFVSVRIVGLVKLANFPSAFAKHITLTTVAMRHAILVFATMLSLALAGCGTYVPSIREWPDTEPLRENDMIYAIVKSVGCELSYTVTRTIIADRQAAKDRPSHRRYADFLLGWGVEVALNLTVVEKAGVNPSVIFTPLSPPSSIFTLAGGLSASSEATRLQKMNVFYSVRDLYKPLYFPNIADIAKCRNPRGDNQGSLLVDNDLRLSSLLESRLGATSLGFANEPGAPELNGEKNVLTQTVSFKIETSGNITPAWKLVRASINPAGNFLSSNRDRTHEIVFTFGPIEKSASGLRTLVPVAENSHLITQLITGIRAQSLGSLQ